MYSFKKIFVGKFDQNYVWNENRKNEERISKALGSDLFNSYKVRKTDGYGKKS